MTSKSDPCSGGTTCGTGGHAAHPAPGALDEYLQQQALRERLARIGRKIVVLSGKGGVGKSTVAVNVATALSMAGKRVGLLDVDIHGPSVPTLLGLEGAKIHGDENGLLPVEVNGLKVMSLGFLLDDPDEAVIWRGPMKMGVIRQFLSEVAWGDLDVLVIDSPPGTGDEPLSVCQLIGDLHGAVIVTTPQRVAAVDVRKSVTFCRRLRVPVLGIVENMSGFACPTCGEVTPILGSGGGRRIAADMKVPFLGSLPFDPRIVAACDGGRAFLRDHGATPAAEALHEVARTVLSLDGPRTDEARQEKTNREENRTMRIAIPLADGKLALHFGHCAHFALIDVDPGEKKILRREDVAAPPHEPGKLPAWLAQHGANVIIAGGMGQRALALFAEQGIQVVVGAPPEAPEKLVAEHLAGTLRVGGNVCDH
ncbi:MAG: P-loop NTPase [Acidobacteria bacterium]|nr:P-loop NTPase [Acidobacteriota bacterium]